MLGTHLDFHRHCAGDEDAVLTKEEGFQASDCCQIAWLDLLFADIRTTWDHLYMLYACRVMSPYVQLQRMVYFAWVLAGGHREWPLETQCFQCSSCGLEWKLGQWWWYRCVIVSWFSTFFQFGSCCSMTLHWLCAYFLSRCLRIVGFPCIWDDRSLLRWCWKGSRVVMVRA